MIRILGWSIFAVLYSVSTGLPAQARDTAPAENEGKPALLEYRTEIPAGIIYGSFTKEDGPYLLNGSVIVPSGQKLEFEPGCQVLFGGDYVTLTVFGRLVANGTAREPVVFRSAKRNPRPWDWDRIYCRSRNRSLFKHCIIQNSNYGIVVENGGASIERCIFQQNSLHGLVIRNSTVSIRKSTFTGGHVLAMFCQEGARVTADSLSIRHNITGLACAPKSSVRVRKGGIIKNTHGIAIKKNASVTIIDADITKNKSGLVSLQEVPRKVREMVYANTIDMRIVTPSQMEKLLKPPEAVKSIVLPKTKTDVVLDKTFKPGFAATKAPREQTVSFMGNVTLGFKGYLPESENDTSLLQTRYPGEMEGYGDNIQPEFQIFASGRRKDADINLLADVYRNEWNEEALHLRKNTFNLQMNYLKQHLVVGDFFESQSETSISGRKMTGVKYSGAFVPMGKGANRLEFKLAGGETEVPKDSGDNDITLFNETVDSGMSIRQQLTYVAGVSVNPTLNSQVNVTGIISRDQGFKPIFREVISDPGAPDPIKAQTGAIDGSVSLLTGRLRLSAEIDAGVHDTLYDTISADSNEISEIAWYNPEVGEAVPAVFNALTDADHIAGSIGASGLFDGYELNAKYTEIRPGFFSAGNPYLEADRRKIAVGAEKQIVEHLLAEAELTYERRNVSYEFAPSLTGSSSPIDKYSLDLGGEYEFGKKYPSLDVDYRISFERNDKAGEKLIQHQEFADVPVGTEVTPVVVDTTINDTDYIETTVMQYAEQDLKNLVSLQVKQRLENGIDYSLKYRLLRNNELTGHPDPTENNEDDDWQHQISGKFGFKIKRIIKNKLSFRITTKDEVRDNTTGLSFKFDDKLRITIIPRKLNLTLKGEYSDKAEEEDVDAGREETVINSYSFETELKFSVTSKLSIATMGKYEKMTDDNEGSQDNYNVVIGGLHVTYLF
ncbi:MAG: hypothetical protein GF398_17270 [Chitinivibrionales bacterium]|nr:hypothetical protein [Chitinivibrionales bacterium]